MWGVYFKRSINSLIKDKNTNLTFTLSSIEVNSLSLHGQFLERKQFCKSIRFLFEKVFDKSGIETMANALSLPEIMNQLYSAAGQIRLIYRSIFHTWTSFFFLWLGPLKTKFESWIPAIFLGFKFESWIPPLIKSESLISTLKCTQEWHMWNLNPESWPVWNLNLESLVHLGDWIPNPRPPSSTALDVGTFHQNLAILYRLDQVS